MYSILLREAGHFVRELNPDFFTVTIERFPDCGGPAVTGQNHRGQMGGR
jgi:hypothetical protein